MQGLLPRGFSRFDIVQGYYYWLVDHHEGQWSKSYARLCKVSHYYKPGMNESEPDEIGMLVYDELCSRHQCTHKSFS